MTSAATVPVCYGWGVPGYVCVSSAGSRGDTKCHEALRFVTAGGVSGQMSTGGARDGTVRKGAPGWFTPGDLCCIIW